MTVVVRVQIAHVRSEWKFISKANGATTDQCKRHETRGREQGSARKKRSPTEEGHFATQSTWYEYVRILKTVIDPRATEALSCDPDTTPSYWACYRPIPWNVLPSLQCRPCGFRTRRVCVSCPIPSSRIYAMGQDLTLTVPTCRGGSGILLRR